ncbi:MAG: hypothetical protein R3332_02350 [Pseudohongiellaceae bacterium]|nr:hypothetical protein [Pseudohongiellaceae bacterium]
MENKKLSTREIVALASSVAIIITAAIYWSIQIDGVMEMLELAYG